MSDPILTDDRNLTRAVYDVLTERAKQRVKWGDNHDDEHSDGSLAATASLLAYPNGYDANQDPLNAVCIPAPSWGMALLARHAGDTREQLVIAAALLLAEIERIDRGGSRG